MKRGKVVAEFIDILGVALFILFLVAVGGVYFIFRLIKSIDSFFWGDV